MKKVGWITRTPDLTIERVLDLEMSQSPWTPQEDAVAEAQAIIELPPELRESFKKFCEENEERLAELHEEMVERMRGSDWWKQAQNLPYAPLDGYIDGLHPDKQYLVREEEEGEIVGSIGPGRALDIDGLVVGKKYEVWEEDEQEESNEKGALS